jgi:large repetitive protein
MKKITTTILLTFVLLVPFRGQSQIIFTEHSIDENFAGVSTICPIDLDKDGLKDLVCGSETTSSTNLSIGIWWLRNNGDGTWTRHEIDGNFKNVMSLEIADIDRDGNPDVLASGWNANQIAYWKNGGGSIPVWTKVTVRANFTNAHDAHPFDLNNDALTDIVGVSAQLGRVVAWYQKPDGSFTEQVIDNDFTGGRAVAIADYNSDGNTDITAVSATKKQLVVYYANNENPVVWTKEVIAQGLDGAHEVINYDADNDGDIDLLTSSYNSNQIDSWKNNGASPVVWSREPVGYHVGVNRALPADFDDDGDFDVVATGKFPTSKLSLWNNQSGTPNTFSETIINDQLLAFWALSVDDFDNDGDLDFISGASVSGVIRWWKNNLNTSINEEEVGSEGIMKVFPNPVKSGSTLEIDNGYTGDVVVRLINLSGTTVISKKLAKATQRIQIDLQNDTILPGMYCLMIQCGSIFQCKHIIVL